MLQMRVYTMNAQKEQYIVGKYITNVGLANKAVGKRNGRLDLRLYTYHHHHHHHHHAQVFDLDDVDHIIGLQWSLDGLQ